jgi:AraC family transcriptional regulator
MDKSQQIAAVNRVQEYIKAHLRQQMTLHEIAQYAGYSPWYISKIFKEYTNKTIFEYIRSVRLTGAALNLRDNDTQVIDVALEFIFDTHEGFTRAFSKEFGIAPKKYSMHAPPIKLFFPYLIYDDASTRGENDMDKNTTVIFP